jgi:7-carboxy-7-deazaguanine synthase
MSISAITSAKETLVVNEIFDSIQGETTLAGLMSSFIRLTGCPFRCAWCDSTFSYEEGSSLTVVEILSQISSLGWKPVCVTGGEPLIQPATPLLLQELVHKGHLVSLETGGSCSTEKVPESVRIILDIKCPQSGMCHKNYWENIDRLRTHDEVKFVIQDRSDYDWAKSAIKKHNLFQKVSTVLFSPVWSVLEPSLLVQWLREDSLPVRVNIQLHKYIWGPTVRGV